VDTLLHRFGDKIKGVLEGFDRIVFKGRLKPLCCATGMAAYLYHQGVLNKDYKDWALHTSAAIVRDAEEYSMSQRGTGIEYLSSCHIRKEANADTKKDYSFGDGDSKYNHQDTSLCRNH